MPDFFAHYGSEEQCAAALRAMRWPDGHRCPRCGGAGHYVVGHGAHPAVSIMPKHQVQSAWRRDGTDGRFHGKKGTPTRAGMPRGSGLVFRVDRHAHYATAHG